MLKYLRSRIISLNLGAIVLTILPVLAGFDWSLFFDPKTAALILFGLNILLRLDTTGPVGGAEQPSGEGE